MGRRKKPCTNVLLNAFQRKPVWDMLKGVIEHNEMTSFQMSEMYPQFTQLWNNWVDSLVECEYIDRTNGWIYNPKAKKRTRGAVYKPGKRFEDVKRLFEVLSDFVFPEHT